MAALLCLRGHPFGVHQAETFWNSFAAVDDRRFSVSSSFPSWLTLVGARPLSAMSLRPHPHANLE